MGGEVVQRGGWVGGWVRWSYCSKVCVVLLFKGLFYSHRLVDGLLFRWLGGGVERGGLVGLVFKTLHGCGHCPKAQVGVAVVLKARWVWP